MKKNADRFHFLMIVVHWLSVPLLIAVYATIFGREYFPKGSTLRDGLKIWHFMLGMVVFGLVFVRVILLVIFRSPPITPTPPAWQEFLRRAMHFALYAFLVVVPLLGWLTLSAKGKTIPFFGFDMPALIAPDKNLAHTLEDIHENLGIAGLYLIGLHTAASLFHHYILRDNALTRMLPKRGCTLQIERK